MQISACYFEKDDVYYASTKKVTPAGVMELGSEGSAAGGG